jgi:hypothetical protein
MNSIAFAVAFPRRCSFGGYFLPARARIVEVVGSARIELDGDVAALGTARSGGGRVSGASNPKRAPMALPCVCAGGPSSYCLGAGGSACWEGSTAGVEPLSSEGPAQSPAQSFVPLTVPTSLQPVGASGFTCFAGLPPTLGTAI